ncbi:hypothetical protein F5887DRAFT_476214 [Amanita rubescens]|nr:hypothetical protein F5887DRAFT_476214 [Amanita rubescens]
MVEVLAGVKELYIKQMFEALPGEFVDFAHDMVKSHDMYLPNLRVLQVPCCPEHFQQLIPEACPFFEEPDVSPLEKLIVTVNTAGNCGCCGSQCGGESTAIDYTLKIMCRWPSFSVIYLNYDQPNLILILHALVASTVVDLAIYYPSHKYYSEDSYRHYNILENKRLAVNT